MRLVGLRFGLLALLVLAATPVVAASLLFALGGPSVSATALLWFVGAAVAGPLPALLLADHLIVRPVRLLAETAARFAAGETVQALTPPARVRELAALGEALERAAAHLERRRVDAEAMRAEYRQRAESDAVTGLANRHAFDRALAEATATSRAGGAPFALFMIDVDHFKLINDRFGHEAGDQLLRTIARRLETAVRDTDLVARIAGDEFAVLLRDRVVELGVADQVAERIVRGVAGPVRLGSAMVVPKVSVGYAIHPADGDGTGPVAAADAALYAAKRSGRGQWQRWRGSEPHPV